MPVDRILTDQVINRHNIGPVTVDTTKVAQLSTAQHIPRNVLAQNSCHDTDAIGNARANLSVCAFRSRQGEGCLSFAGFRRGTVGVCARRECRGLLSASDAFDGFDSIPSFWTELHQFFLSQ